MDTTPFPSIRLLVLDVDGTLTDGAVYMGPTGEAMKAFSAQDGLGLQMMAAAGVQVAIITGRSSGIVARRAAELAIPYVFQGIMDKASCLRRLAAELAISLSEAAYMGDDLNDLPAMALCGMAACPANAAADVRRRADFVAPHAGGQGAVRDFCEYYLRGAGLWASAARRRFGADLS